MLGLSEQALLLDALKPPPGMELDAAVGTTFTLDLSALLSIPVAQSFERGNDTEDSAHLLELIRRYADRTVLFCQAGAISIPPRYRAALTFVEQTVLEVRKPDGGLFHPKLWVVRFRRRDRVVHRAIIMSRNLTFDRAWDVLVRLDEQQGSTGISAAPLREFIEWLPGQTAREVSPAQQALVRDLVSSLRGVHFEIPEPFTAGEIMPLWRGSSGRPFHPECDNALAISPFLTASSVEAFLATGRRWRGVVSRRAALDTSASALTRANDVLRIRDVVLDADQDLDEADASSADAPASDTSALGRAAALRGLHAKIYLQDVGPQTSLWLGSPNLTQAAFTTNVELLVRLDGPRRAVGYDQLIQRKSKGSLFDILEDHTFSEGVSDDDAEATALEHHACDIASRTVILELTGDEDDRTATLTIDVAGLPPEVEVSASLCTLRDDVRQVLGGTASWQNLSQKHVTPFVLLRLKLAEGSTSILVRANLVGDSESRRGNVLASAIADREGFLRYLAALLGLPVAALADGEGRGAWTGLGFGSTGHLDRVLEDLLTTASRNPRRLASLEQTLRALEADDDTRNVIPPTFRQLWDAVYSAQKAAIR